jgi:hypothetical protein
MDHRDEPGITPINRARLVQELYVSRLRSWSVPLPSPLLSFRPNPKAEDARLPSPTGPLSGLIMQPLIVSREPLPLHEMSLNLTLTVFLPLLGNHGRVRTQLTLARCSSTRATT